MVDICVEANGNISFDTETSPLSKSVEKPFVDSEGLRILFGVGTDGAVLDIHDEEYSPSKRILNAARDKVLLTRSKLTHEEIEDSVSMPEPPKPTAAKVEIECSFARELLAGNNMIDGVGYQNGQLTLLRQSFFIDEEVDSKLKELIAEETKNGSYDPWRKARAHLITEYPDKATSEIGVTFYRDSEGNLKKTDRFRYTKITLPRISIQL